MAIDLPEASSAAFSSPRRRGTKLPDARNVPTIQPTRDPGLPAVQVPANAFGQETAAAIGDFGASLANVGGQLLEAERKAKVSAATAAATGELRAFTDDLSIDPDHETYSERYKAKAEEIFAKYSQGLDSRSMAAFRAAYQRLSIDRAGDLRRAANKHAIDSATANLDTATDEYAHVAAGASSKEEHDAAVLSATQAIEAQAESGVITFEEAGKRKRTFAGRLDEVKVLQEISADPENAITLLGDRTMFENLDEKRRQSLLDTAVRKAELRATKARAEADRQDRLAEKRLKAEGDALLKNIYEKDTPTADDLEAAQNHPGVTPAEFKGLKKIAAGGADEDDTTFLADIMPRIHTEDLSGELTRAVESNRLTSKTYISLMGKNKSALSSREPDNPYKSGRRFLVEGLDPGQLGGDPYTRQALSIAQQNALVDYDNWFDKNEAADRGMAIEHARVLMTTYQNVAFDKMRLALPRPRGFTGSKQAVTPEDVTRAEAELARMIRAQEISDAEAAREIDSLKVWRSILVQQQQKPKPK